MRLGKKLWSILLTMVMVFAMMVPAMAANETTTDIVITNGAQDSVYSAWRVLDAVENNGTYKYSVNDKYLDDLRAVIGDEPYYIILEHSDTNSYPECKPDDFKGSDPGSLLYVRNEASDGSYELPSTGGMGTHWFVLGGLMMMFSAGTLIIKKQRKKSEENS